MVKAKMSLFWPKKGLVGPNWKNNIFFLINIVLLSNYEKLNVVCDFFHEILEKNSLINSVLYIKLHISQAENKIRFFQ